MLKQISSFALLSVLSTSSAIALPNGAQIVSGTVSMIREGSNLSITNTPGSIINWHGGYSIGSNETVRYIQQSATSAVLNRDMGGMPSQIFGSLQSNGRVFIVNPNGIIFGATSRIDVSGLLASSLAISDKDFLEGRLSFQGIPGNGSVENLGVINAPGGNVYLLAPDVRNSGLISSENGDVLLAAGHSVTLIPDASPNLRVEISAPTKGTAVNVGQIIAKSGSIGILGADVVQDGVLDAQQVVHGANGRVFIKGLNSLVVGPHGRIEADDGNITLTSVAATTVEAGANIRADRGSVTIWSDSQTKVHGTIRSRDGFIETSGRHLDMSGAVIDAQAGQWLIDPQDVEIVSILPLPGTGWSTTSYILNTMLDAVLNAGTSVTISTVGAPVSAEVPSSTGTAGPQPLIGGAGNISVLAPITKTLGGDAGINLLADWGIDIRADIRSTSGRLDVHLEANRSYTDFGAFNQGFSISNGANIVTNGGSFTSTGAYIRMTSGSVSTSGGVLGFLATGYGQLTHPFDLDISGNVGTPVTLDAGAGNITMGSGYGIRIDNASLAANRVRLDTTGAIAPLSGIQSSAQVSTANGQTRIVTSQLSLAGGANANFFFGPQVQVSAPTAVQTAAHAASHPILTLACNCNDLDLSVGTDAAGGLPWATDVNIGTITFISGINSVGAVHLATANGNIGQTVPIVAASLDVAAGGPGNRVDLPNSGNNLSSTLTGSAGQGVGTTGTSFRFVNGGSLATGGIDGGSGALYLATETGDITLQGALSTSQSGTAGSPTTAVVLAAGRTLSANIINLRPNLSNHGGLPNAAIQLSGTHSRFVAFADQFAGSTLLTAGAGTIDPILAVGGRYFETYYGPAWWSGATSTTPGIPATNFGSTNNPSGSAFVFATPPTLTVTKTPGQIMVAGLPQPVLTYTVSGLLAAAGDAIANTPFTGTLALAGTSSNWLPNSQPSALIGTLSSFKGYNINFVSAPLQVVAPGYTSNVGTITAPPSQYPPVLFATSLAQVDVFDVCRP